MSIEYNFYLNAPLGPTQFFAALGRAMDLQIKIESTTKWALLTSDLAAVDAAVRPITSFRKEFLLEDFDFSATLSLGLRLHKVTIEEQIQSQQTVINILKALCLHFDWDLLLLRDSEKWSFRRVQQQAEYNPGEALWGMPERLVQVQALLQKIRA